jgi:hypothetical protein
VLLDDRVLRVGAREAADRLHAREERDRGERDLVALHAAQQPRAAEPVHTREVHGDLVLEVPLVLVGPVGRGPAPP